MTVKLIVGRNIRKIRKYLHMTQEELASAIHMTRTSIANIEVGRQNISEETVQNIANALNVPITMLYHGVEVK